jgi:hypothetical protein
MPIRELILRLAGAIIALLATLTLVLCLAETRWHLGRSEWGLWWLPGRWLLVPRFTTVWYPLIVMGTIDTALGFLLAGKLATKRSIVCALAGAFLAIGLGMVIFRDWPRLYGRAGLNAACLGGLCYSLMGGLAGAWATEKTGRGRRSTWKAGTTTRR